MDISKEHAAFRCGAEVSSSCLPCKGVTSCWAGGKTFLGCILGRKAKLCSGPYADWETFEREAEKEDRRDGI